MLPADDLVFSSYRLCASDKTARSPDLMSIKEAKSDGECRSYRRNS